MRFQGGVRYTCKREREREREEGRDVYCYNNVSLEIATFKPVCSHILFTQNWCWSTFQVQQYTAKNKIGHEHDDRADKKK